jgi:signal transduction histidine kinase
VVLFLLLISLIYVALKDFKAIRGYSLAFLISLAGMIISMFALYGFEWIPFLPYNNTFVPATLIEILILGYILADRANQHRLQQHQMQHQLIIQLQENLRQRDKLLHIRDEIARDLHDQVGATLTSIAISTKLVQKKVGLQQTDIEPILAQIKADSEDTILNIRDTVWALNPDNDAPEKFLERLRTVACQLLANQGITLTFDNEVELEALPPFSMEQRRNLFLVYKEALHNIVKHAQASKVSIQIRHLEGHLQVTVSDNGHGFDPAAQTDGNGLINFQKRANEGGFSVWVTSAEGAGTTVKMQIPVLELADQAFYASKLTKLKLGRIPP